MKKADKAVGKFKEGYNCAQSVLFAMSDDLEIGESLALKISTGFGAGMGRTQHVCGAVSGAVLAINMKYGCGTEEDKTDKRENYLKVQQFISAFEKENGTVSCRDLLDGCELLSDEGQKRFGEENMIERCYGYVQYAVKILEDMFEE